MDRADSPGVIALDPRESAPTLVTTGPYLERQSGDDYVRFNARTRRWF